MNGTHSEITATKESCIGWKSWFGRILCGQWSKSPFSVVLSLRYLTLNALVDKCARYIPWGVVETTFYKHVTTSSVRLWVKSRPVNRCQLLELRERETCQQPKKFGLSSLTCLRAQIRLTERLQIQLFQLNLIKYSPIKMVFAHELFTVNYIS